MDAAKVNTPAEERLRVQQFFMRLFKDSRYKNSRFVVMIEAQMGHMSSGHIEEHIMQIPQSRNKVYCAIDSRDRLARAGVQTTKFDKIQYVLDMRERLQAGGLFFEKNMVGPDQEIMKQNLRTQFEGFIIKKKPRAEFSMREDEYVVGGKSSGYDDLCMALQIANTHMIHIIAEDDIVRKGFVYHPRCWQVVSVPVEPTAKSRTTATEYEAAIASTASAFAKIQESASMAAAQEFEFVDVDEDSEEKDITTNSNTNPWSMFGPPLVVVC